MALAIAFWKVIHVEHSETGPMILGGNRGMMADLLDEPANWPAECADSVLLRAASHPTNLHACFGDHDVKKPLQDPSKHHSFE